MVSPRPTKFTDYGEVRHKMLHKMIMAPIFCPSKPFGVCRTSLRVPYVSPALPVSGHMTSSYREKPGWFHAFSSHAISPNFWLTESSSHSRLIVLVHLFQFSKIFVSLTGRNGHYGGSGGLPTGIRVRKCRMYRIKIRQWSKRRQNGRANTTLTVT